MIRWQKVFTLVKKEIKSWLDNPTSYLALVVFVFLWEFLFFRNAFLIGEASLRSLYDFLPWLLLLFASAVTMSSFSQEKSEGTIETLLTHPVTEIEVVLSKFLSCLVFLTFGLLFALPIAFSFSFFGKIDFGIVFCQILASLLFACSLTSLGLFLSNQIANSTASLLATAALGFLLILAGSEFVTANLPLPLVPVFERLSFLSHFVSLSRGVIDFKDVWYFLSFSAIFLSLTYLQLLKRKAGNRQTYYRSFQIGIWLLVGIFLLTNIISNRLPGRLDLTAEKIYTLSPVTKETLKNLPDLVNITFYVSSKLPTQLIPTVREVKDLLREYQSLAKNNLLITFKDPAGNQQIAQEALSKGLKEIQFNVIGQEEFQVKTGFVGLDIAYAGKNEIIPYIDNPADLEYQLTSLIIKLTTKDKKTVSFLSGHGEKSSLDYQTFKKELEKQFNIQTLTLEEKNPEIKKENQVVIVAGPTSALDENTQKALKNYLFQGGNLFLLNDVYTINLQTLTPQAVSNNLDKILEDLGIKPEKNIVYDLTSHETVRIGAAPISFLLPYPFWPDVFPNPNLPFVKRIERVVLPWPGALSLDENKAKEQGYQLLKLLSTTKYAGSQSENIILQPDKVTFSKENLQEKTVAVAATPQTEGKGKIIVVTDSDFLTEQFASFSPQNISFGVAAVSWLASEKSLADIKVKQTTFRRLIFNKEYQPSLVKYGNLAFSVILPTCLGLTRILRRKKLRKLVYQPNEKLNS